jgi:hypothetical protein
MRVDSAALIQAVRDDFRERLSDIDRYFTDTIEDMNNSIETVKIMARDSVSKKEQELQDVITKHTVEI